MTSTIEIDNEAIILIQNDFVTSNLCNNVSININDKKNDDIANWHLLIETQSMIGTILATRDFWHLSFFFLFFPYTYTYL